MKTSYSDQIKAVQTAMRGAALLVTDDSQQEFINALNDAGSSLAALNITSGIQSSRERDLVATISMLIQASEQDNVDYSLLEHARKLIFTPDGPNS